MVFHFLHFHFFNYEVFPSLCLYVLFLFFSPENSLSCFLPFAIGLLIIYINCLKLYVLRKSALCQLCYKHFPPGFHLIFVCGFSFFCHTRLLNIYVVKYITLSVLPDVMLWKLFVNSSIYPCLVFIFKFTISSSSSSLFKFFIILFELII